MHAKLKNYINELQVKGRLDDAQILELLLSGVPSVKPVKNVVSELLDACGTLTDVCALPYEHLASKEGVLEEGAAILKGCYAAMQSAVSEMRPDNNYDGLFSIDKLASLINPRLLGLKEEKMFAALIDVGTNIIDMFEIAHGSGNSVAYDKRLIIERIAQCRARKIVVVHNHFLTPYPSIQDVSETKRLSVVMEAYGVEFVDHIIFCNNKVFSLREEGYLKDNVQGLQYSTPVNKD